MQPTSGHFSFTFPVATSHSAAVRPYQTAARPPLRSPDSALPCAPGFHTELPITSPIILLKWLLTTSSAVHGVIRPSDPFHAPRTHRAPVILLQPRPSKMPSSGLPRALRTCCSCRVGESACSGLAQAPPPPRGLPRLLRVAARGPPPRPLCAIPPSLLGASMTLIVI